MDANSLVASESTQGPLSSATVNAKGTIEFRERSQQEKASGPVQCLRGGLSKQGTERVGRSYGIIMSALGEVCANLVMTLRKAIWKFGGTVITP
jgi:hypothetical protein